MSVLTRLIVSELARPVPVEVTIVATELAGRLSGSAVLFYGSNLRRGDLEGVLDFYVLRGRDVRGHPLGRLIWPDVSYHELPLGSLTLRAKVAAMPLDIFERAAGGQTLDSTIWTRFVQPAALVWCDSDGTRDRVIQAVQLAIVTASRFAVLHHDGPGRPADIWEALFRSTYDVEFRIEPPGRERQLIGADVERYDRLLPLAWREGGIAYRRSGDRLEAKPTRHHHLILWRAWLRTRRAGRWINVARLLKASMTFDGAARYALWKIERHTGVRIPLTPFRERHPILSAPFVLWRLWRARA